MEHKLFYVGIKAVIRDADSILFLLGAKNGKQYWDMAGGRIDTDESDNKTTLLRELHEELPGIEDVQVGTLLYAGKREFDFPDGTGLFLVFYDVKANLKNVTLSDEHREMRWVKIDELDSLLEDESIQCSKLFITAANIALQRN